MQAQHTTASGQTRPAARDNDVSQRMSTMRTQDTKPERALRTRLHKAGLRYRVHLPVPGMARRKIDIAFTLAKVAVFVDGCFWHGCPEHCRLPNHNRDWWVAKIDGNRQRDAETSAHLEKNGWTVVRVWEHLSAEDAAETVGDVVSGPSGQPTTPSPMTTSPANGSN